MYKNNFTFFVVAGLERGVETLVMAFKEEQKRLHHIIIFEETEILPPRDAAFRRGS